MAKQFFNLLLKIEKHYNAIYQDEEALAVFSTWCAANPPNVPVDGGSFDFHAWCESVPREHQLGLTHWFLLALEAAIDTSSELV